MDNYIFKRSNLWISLWVKYQMVYDLFSLVFSDPSQVQTRRILFILVGSFPGLFVRVAIVVAVATRSIVVTLKRHLVLEGRVP